MNDDPDDLPRGDYDRETGEVLSSEDNPDDNSDDTDPGTTESDDA